jgi:hypothetical protein
MQILIGSSYWNTFVKALEFIGLVITYVGWYPSKNVMKYETFISIDRYSSCKILVAGAVASSQGVVVNEDGFPSFFQ